MKGGVSRVFPRVGRPDQSRYHVKYNNSSARNSYHRVDKVVCRVQCSARALRLPTAIFIIASLPAPPRSQPHLARLAQPRLVTCCSSAATP
ncbi:hypothetical protein E2C01_093063 [Portunus trituberculatus]|uniref:Uncharacterized protein n=1 Tax=Portunus trituberculatus TaxID=210409 RepID=A0A5B7JZJ8_PORTR|nr:hypothetical protein [Portunus trituberculatus]